MQAEGDVFARELGRGGAAVQHAAMGHAFVGEDGERLRVRAQDVQCHRQSMRARDRELRAKDALLARQRVAALADGVEADLADGDDAGAAAAEPLVERAHGGVAGGVVEPGHELRVQAVRHVEPVVRGGERVVALPAVGRDAGEEHARDARLARARDHRVGVGEFLQMHMRIEHAIILRVLSSTAMESTIIRAAEARDLDAVVGLVRALAEFEKLPGPDDAAARRLADDFAAGRYALLVADAETRLVGYALYFFTYSTFLARPSLYLEDLFVHPDARGRGIGARFMQQLAVEAEARGCGRFEWSVLDWNVHAQKFYKGLGAELLDDWRWCRMTGEAITTLARNRARPSGGR